MTIWHFYPTNRESSETTGGGCARFLARVDARECATALLLLLVFAGVYAAAPARMHIPRGDSLSSFPHREAGLHVSAAGAFVAVPFVWTLIGAAYALQRRMPSAIAEFRLGAALWTHAAAVLLPGIFALALAAYVGRARPDFFARCGSRATEEMCSLLSERELRDEFRAFPSVEAAMALASMVFLSLFLITACRGAPTWAHCAFLAPVMLGLWIGALPVKFYRCHTDDAVAGYFVGALCAWMLWKDAKRKIFKQ